MRNTIIILIFILLISILFSSCQSEVKTDYVPFCPKPVLNSFIVAGSPISAHISLAVGFEENLPISYDSAIVSLFIDDIFTCNMTLKADGVYETEIIANENTKYTITADLLGFERVSGSTHIPAITEIYDFQHINVAGIDNEGYSYPGIKFTFKNDLSQRNYYDSRIYMRESELISFINPVYISDSVLLNEGTPLTIFSDKIIQNIPEYRMQLNYTTGITGYNNFIGSHTELFPFIFEFRSLSEEFYNYTKQLYLYETGRFPEFGIGSNITYPMYSNVENGYGIVAGYSFCITDTIRPSY
ncbi:MAG: DUF4249 family protein [Bacteroidales bacterium]|jgi:hypothetical protein|nr:DUF4249 family protein [Bacteroidales bacterium]MDD3011420.1 DUF4249 family protein [Bacteroidales bacterium]MDD3962503.1 DUF4249 family protein [Bacteroidales bacterium]MDY0286370.1 DUF4249 family protein [Bacteroidales bacterium]